MPDLTAILRPLQWLTLIGYCGLLFKIYLEPALRRYRYFAAYLAIMAAREVLALLIPQRTTLYGWVYIIGAPIVWVCYILVVFELYSNVLGSYKGIATVGRHTLRVTLGLSILLAGSTLVWDLSGKHERFPVLLTVLATERWVISSLAVLLLCITVFMIWFPVPLKRNIVVHSLVFFLYFISKALALFFRNTLGPSAVDLVNLAVTCTAVACLMIWIFFLSREGERQEIKQRIQWNPDSEKRLLHQLDSINASLLRSARK
jgi:hypothetical protein